MGKLIHYTNNT